MLSTIKSLCGLCGQNLCFFSSQFYFSLTIQPKAVMIKEKKYPHCNHTKYITGLFFVSITWSDNSLICYHDNYNPELH